MEYGMGRVEITNSSLYPVTVNDQRDYILKSSIYNTSRQKVENKKRNRNRKRK